MRNITFLSGFLLLSLLWGCETNSSGSLLAPKYQPTDGRNLSPDLPQQFQQDPQWPNDANRGGGGGNTK